MTNVTLKGPVFGRMSIFSSEVDYRFGTSGTFRIGFSYVNKWLQIIPIIGYFYPVSVLQISFLLNKGCISQAIDQ